MKFGARTRRLGEENEQPDSQIKDSRLASGWEIGELELADLIDAPALQSLMDDFYALAHVPMSIIDLKDRMLVGVGWQRVCLQFHRVHPVTNANCMESDLQLTAGLTIGETKLYKCRNNMWDIATPILIGGQHVGNVFSGQFFFDDELPDYELFRTQARQYGFDEEAYLAALDQAPRLSRETVNRAMAFFVKLAQMVSQLSYSNLQLTHSLVERDALMGSLRESEQRWQTTLTSVGDGVIATDVNGSITFLNHVAEVLTGWTHSQAAGQPVEVVFNIINESSRQIVDNPVRKVLWMGSITGLTNHTLLVRKDGSEISIDDSAAPIHGVGGQITGAVLVFRDITERRRVEREQAWLASFPKLNPNPILEISLGGRIEYINPKADELFPDLQEQGTAHPYLDGWEDIAVRIRSDPSLEIHREVRVGDRYYNQSMYFNQEYGRIRAYGMDITKRKQAEEALVESARKLARSNLELEQFAFVASHDLQEPLRKICMFGDRLSEHFGEDCPAEAKDYLNRMLNAAERMQAMIAGLLELSRVNTRGRTFTLIPLNQVVEEALSDLETRVRATGGQVNVADLPVIEADGMQIRQLFQNLIGNALKFHKPGVSPVIRISATSRQASQIDIRMEDNGIGFDEQYADRIFQPFQRLHGRSEYEGTGLGLAICQKIVERHHGQIEVHSQSGEGATFIIHLPVKQAQ